MAHRDDRGAAAVEMAIILPMLLLVIGGIVDLGRLFYTNQILTNAAREGARMAALSYTTSQVNARVASAVGTSLGPAVVATPSITQVCPAATGATVTVTATGFTWILLDTIPGLFGATLDPPTLSATGNMRCE